MVSKLAWVLLFCVPCAAPGSDDPLRRPSDVVSVSASGDYRLRLVRASQTSSPWDKSIAAVSMDFQLEVTRPAPNFLPTQLPDNLFLEQADPLVSACASPSELVSTNKHFGWTANDWSRSVTIHNLEIGRPRTWLHSLELGVTLVQATDWEQYSFTVTRPGTNEVMRCGPLKIHLEGKDDRVFVSFTSFSRDEKERGEYAKRVPLAFPTIHSYGVSHASVTDSKKRELFCSTSGITGGSSFGMFEISQPILLNSNDVHEARVPNNPLPVVMQNKQIPKKEDKLESPPTETGHDLFAAREKKLEFPPNAATNGKITAKEERLEYPLTVGMHEGIAPPKKQEKLEYPLAVTVRFPKQYRQQRVTFDFRNIPLPPLQN